MEVDYLIVGQGIAGTNLSYHLIEKGSRVLVVGQPAGRSSSRVAAGIVNPVTGKKLSKTWRADNLFPYLTDFYQMLEAKLGSTFFYPKPIYRLYTSIEEQNTWITRTAQPEYSLYTKPIPGRLYTHWLNNPYGGLEITGGGYLDVPVFLDAYQRWLEQKGSFLAGNLAAESLQLMDGFVKWKDIKAAKVVFCDGYIEQANAYFEWLPFRPVKGELLQVQVPEAQLDHIINRHEFILPTQEASIFRVGATYEWDQLHWQATEGAKNELISRLNGLLKVPFTVLDQWAGIRPATADRRPFIGLHPAYPQIGIFNGFGTKGVSLTPLLASEFTEHLQLDKELNPEVHILRYLSLYYVNKK